MTIKDVFIVVERWCFESEDEVHGVYETLEEAERAKEELEIKYKEYIEKLWCDGFYIQKSKLYIEVTT